MRRKIGRGFTGLFTRAASIALGCAFTIQAPAQLAFQEAEPNETPETANRIEKDVRIIGSMAPGDQDGYLWTVSDVDAVKRWTFELQGIPGVLTIVDVLRLDYTDDGSRVAGSEKLFKIGSRDGNRPGRAGNLLFEPGEYLLGVARAGGSAGYRPAVDTAAFGDGVGSEESDEEEDEEADHGYRLAVRQTADVGSHSSSEPNDRREDAVAIRAGREHVAYSEAEESWFELEVPPEDADRVWDLTAQVPVGRSASIELEDDAGEQLKRINTDRLGRMRTSELALAPGRYLVRLVTEPGILCTVMFEPVGAWVEGREAEPNDRWQRANQVNLDEALSGRFQSRGDDDYFSFALDAETADRKLVLETATAAPDQKLTVCLLDAGGDTMQCRSGKGTVTLGGLALDPGDYGMSVGRGGKDTEYTINLDVEGSHEAGSEAEPNDSIELATAFPTKRRIRGRLDRDDQDFFRIMVTEEPQLWRFQAMGEGIHEVGYFDGSGKQVQRVRTRGKQRRVRLENVYLLPGTHYVSVSGREDGEYTLLARPLGPPDPNAEREPNDDETRMHPVGFGQVRTGTLVNEADRDNYRFHLANHDRIRLTIEPPPDGTINAEVYWEDDGQRRFRSPRKGKPLVLEGLFPPGDYRVELSARRPSDAEYRIVLERLDRFGCPVDCEPNDSIAFARPLPAGHLIEGRVGEWRDNDWYAMPVVDTAAGFSIEAGRKDKLALLADPWDDNRLVWDDDTGRYRGELPAGEALFLEVRGNGEYALKLHLEGDDEGDNEVTEPALSMALHLDQTQVAAYWHYGQQVDGRLEVTNESAEPVTAMLEAVTSDYRWRAMVEPERLTIPAGGTASAALRVYVPADAWAQRPVRVSARAVAAGGGQSEAFAEIDADSDAALVAAKRHWDVPEALRGGLNLAWRALGGRWTGEEDSSLGHGLGAIFDGMAVRGQGLTLRGRNELRPYQTTVALAGGDTIEVAGITLNPLSGDRVTRYLRRFELALSEDGQDYRTWLTGALEPVPREQYFPLDTPVPARFARLRLIDDFEGGGRRALGEWKVIARPELDLSGGAGFNLADPDLGGHVVRARPAISTSWDDVILDNDTKRYVVRLQSGHRLAWVQGFHHNRAARITALEWVHSPDGDAENRIDSVDVAASLDSPLGPWQPLGSWSLDGEQNARLDLDAPTWARFVRFTTPAAEGRVNLEAPGAIRILEQPVDESYQSILGEWGFDSSEASYEAQTPVQAPAPFGAAENDSRANAAALEPGLTVDGRVWLGQHEHWYRMQVPGDQNVLSIRLAGEPTVRTRIDVETTGGEPVPLRSTETTARQHQFEARVEPGSEIYFKVAEPPRNVVFAWDTSASVGPYLPVIYNSLVAYARDLVPGRDAANLMPFGSPPLMQDWHGEPYVMQTILNEYPREESSSASETTLKRASEELAPRAGTKAIVLITDAATNRDADVWEAFEEARPRILGLALDSHGAFGRDPVREQDLMQDWSWVNGGHYSHLRSEGEMEVAFDRAAALLRRPAPYTLTVDTAFREAPGPGRLRVVSTGEDTPGDAAGAVELILDASGSMLQRMEGRRRIAIAREVLSEAVTRHLPPGTPVALRVFGQKEPNTCRTDLEIPLGPLDPDAARTVIETIQARNLARTPIADSLALVESDLAQAEGARTVVLVTDGEETCDGDPEAVIRDLQDKGFDVHLNIVGFALDDPALERTFQDWAELGGGRYYQATDSEGLSRALEEALKISYTVLDSSGERVARGIVDGEPLELPAGYYRVAVQGAPPRVFEKVEIPGGDEIVLEIEP